MAIIITIDSQQCPYVLIVISNDQRKSNGNSCLAPGVCVDMSLIH